MDVWHCIMLNSFCFIVYLFQMMRNNILVFLVLRDDWVLVGLCYASDTTFQIMADINDRQKNTFIDIIEYGMVSSLAQLEKEPLARKYYFDQSVG